MNLSEKEKQLILKNRKEAKEYEFYEKRILYLLKLAYEFNRWLHIPGNGQKSFDIFCQRYGYKMISCIKKSIIYGAIGKIMALETAIEKNQYSIKDYILIDLEREIG